MSVIKIIERSGVVNITEQVVRVIRVYDHNLPAGILESIFTAAGQVLGSDGAGSPVVIPAPSAVGQFFRSNAGTTQMGWESVDLSQLVQTAVKTANYTAINNDHVLVDASGASADIDISLPASPTAGNKVRVSLVAGHATWKVTINRNGSLINGSTNVHPWVVKQAGESIYFEYTGATLGWVAISKRMEDGWIPSIDTWTRTGNHTFTIPRDITSIYKPGTQIRYNDGAQEYGVVLSSSFGAGVTTVTLITNTSYTMAAATITDTYYSYAEPPDFPSSFAFTATWSASGTAPAIGNGSISGWFSTRGREIFGSIDLAFGSTTTFGTGTYFWTIPLNVSAYIPVSARGTVGSVLHVGLVYLSGNSVSVAIPAANIWAQTAPVTWANGNAMAIGFWGRF